jgi:hypothetical protein
MNDKMNLQELEQNALQLPLRDRWILVQSLLNSLETETLNLANSKTVEESLAELDPWTKSLIGIVNLDSLESTESYVDYLEEKYR